MSLDEEIRRSIAEAVGDEGQSQALAARLEAWLDGLASGNESLTDRDSVDRHLELLYGSVAVDVDDELEQE